MSKQGENPRQESFCRVYLRTMDPEQAAKSGGYRDGYAQLASASVQGRLERMRETAAGQIRREDAVRRLAQLAFGRANDAAALALGRGSVDAADLDLAAVSELRVSDKGVEVKFVDRIRALEALCGLLESEGGGEAGSLYQLLAGSAGEEDWEHG